MSLTPRQEAIMEFLRTFTAEHGYPPTLREIAEGVGLSNASAVAYQIGLLVDRGILSRAGHNNPRTITINSDTLVNKGGK